MGLGDRVRGFVADYLLVLGDARQRLPLVLFLMLCMTALDLFAVALVAPFTAAMMGQEINLAGYTLGMRGSDLARQLFGWLGAFIIVVFIVKAFVGFRLTRRITEFSEQRRADLMVELLRSMQYQPYAFHLKSNSIDLISRVLSQTGGYSGAVLASSLRLLADGTVTLAVSVLLIWRDMLAFGLLLALLSLVFFFVNNFVRPRLAHATSNYYRCNSESGVAVSQALGALREVRLLGRERYFQRRLQTAANEMAGFQAQQISLSMLPRLVIEAAVVGFLVILSWITLRQGRDIDSLIAVLGMFAVAAMRLMPAATSILTSFSSIRANRSLLASLAGDLRLLVLNKPDLADSTPEEHADADASEARLRLGQFESLELKQVGFNYGDSSGPALSDVSLRIERGAVVGIMGRSGAGKSTLADLVLGLLQPDEGELLVNGQSIRGNLRAWQRMVAYIPQTVFILDDSVRRNIALGVVDAQIDDQRVQRALSQAQLTEVVARLPNGLDTFLGERGVRLSGGQRQRIAIARALYHEREFIIMDEATSALDTETERELIEAIGALHGKKTLLVIAHKASVLEDADVIHHFDAGRLVRSVASGGRRTP